MKFRNGFVSNSSSTSFIVVVNPAKACKHCGRVDKDIIELIQSAENRDGDTELRWTDPSRYIEELNRTIQEGLEELERYTDLNDNHVVQLRYGNQTAGTLRRWAYERVRNARKSLANIMQYVDKGATIVSFEISYHNELLNDLVREQIESGTLVLIEENG